MLTYSTRLMLTYLNVTPAQVAQATAALAANPKYEFSEPEPNEFELKAEGFTVHGWYAPDIQLLTVDANHFIRGRVDEEIKAALGR